MDKNIDKYCVNHNSSIRDALKIIDKNHEGFVLVIDEKKLLKGIATDGDIRRYLLKGGR